MRSQKGLHCTSNAMRRPLSMKSLHRRRAFVARRGARRPSHGLMAISHAVRWRSEVAQAAVTRRAGEQARADDHSAREPRRTRPVLPPLVHTSLATRHGDAADAEHDQGAPYVGRGDRLQGLHIVQGDEEARRESDWWQVPCQQDPLPACASRPRRDPPAARRARGRRGPLAAGVQLTLRRAAAFSPCALEPWRAARRKVVSARACTHERAAGKVTKNRTLGDQGARAPGRARARARAAKAHARAGDGRTKRSLQSNRPVAAMNAGRASG